MEHGVSMLRRKPENSKWENEGNRERNRTRIQQWVHTAIVNDDNILHHRNDMHY